MSLDWNECYQRGETPWDKGKPHPELPFLIREHRDLIEGAGRILVPGCGMGYDAVLLKESGGGAVTGLDVAEEAVTRARRHHPESGVDWRLGDLFTWEESADLVFEHTCFCAIPVDRRPDYVEAVSRILPAGGHLLGVFFLNPDHEGEEGPPFGVTMAELEGFFGDRFEILSSRAPDRTYPGREGEGRERCLLLRRRG